MTLESGPGGRRPRLKKTKRKFVPFGKKEELTCLGRSKVKLRAVAGATIRSMVYVIRDVEESLMGRLDALRLGLVTVRKEGAQEEQVARVDQQTKKSDPEIGSVEDKNSRR